MSSSSLAKAGAAAADLNVALAWQELGIPTANLGADSLRHSLAQAVTGIYCGWSSLGDNSKVGPKPCLLLLALQVSPTVRV